MKVGSTREEVQAQVKDLMYREYTDFASSDELKKVIDLKVEDLCPYVIIHSMEGFRKIFNCSILGKIDKYRNIDKNCIEVQAAVFEQKALYIMREIFIRTQDYGWSVSSATETHVEQEADKCTYKNFAVTFFFHNNRFLHISIKPPETFEDR